MIVLVNFQLTNDFLKTSILFHYILSLRFYSKWKKILYIKKNYLLLFFLNKIFELNYFVV